MEHLPGWIGRIENGIIKERLSILVQPPNNFYWNIWIDIHGITREHTAYAAKFKKGWNAIEPFIKNQNVVAHNGFSFDFHCICQALEYYDILVPDYIKYCTYKIYWESLASLCMKNRIPLNHHNALSDALVRRAL